MPDLLYLDTARLGRMSPGARGAHRDYAELAGTEGCSAYFERFVRYGLAACPAGMRERYPGLAPWRGIAELKQALRVLAGHRPDLPVLLAHRSAQLMKLAAGLLFRPCRNVLVTDLGWPGFHAVLDQEAHRVNRAVTTVAVRDALLGGRLGEAELVEHICAAFARERCDGLFLSSVSNWGVRLPVERIARRLAVEDTHRVWFVVIDGSQEFCHTPGRLESEFCDLYLTGCHKWLAAHHPLGLAFYGRRWSREFIDTVVARLVGSRDLDDPLLQLSGQLETDGTPGVTETVNLLPLFTARAAVEDVGDTAPCRFENARVAMCVARASGWRPLLPAEPLRSGILLLEAEQSVARAVPPEQLRTSLRDNGVAATTYEGGLVRLSMPPTAFTTDELERLGRALARATRST